MSLGERTPTHALDDDLSESSIVPCGSLGASALAASPAVDKCTTNVCSAERDSTAERTCLPSSSRANDGGSPGGSSTTGNTGLSSLPVWRITSTSSSRCASSASNGAASAEGVAAEAASLPLGGGASSVPLAGDGSLLSDMFFLGDDVHAIAAASAAAADR